MLQDPRNMSALGKLGFVLQSVNPEFMPGYMQQLQEQQQMQQLGKMREQEFGLRKEELGMRKEERAYQLRQRQQQEAQRQARLGALGGLAEQYAQQLNIPVEQAQGLISSGAVGGADVLGALQTDPMDALNMQTAQLKNQMLQKELNKPRPTGIADLMGAPQPSQPQALGTLSQAAPAARPSYTEVQRDGYTEYVEGPQPLTFEREMSSLQPKMQQLDNMYERALMTPNFDPGELKKLQALRDKTEEGLDLADQDKRSFETLQATKQDIQEKLLADLRQAKTLIEKGGSKLHPGRLLPGTATSGIEGALGAIIPGSVAYNLNASLDRIRSSGALMTLNEAKSQSKTGATGFGALSEKELKVIMDNIANLSVGQDNAQLLRNINDVERDLMRQLGKIDDGLRSFGFDPGEQVPQAQGVVSLTDFLAE